MRHAKKRVNAARAAILFATGVAVLFSGIGLARAQRAAPAAEVSLDELMKPTDLPDIAVGSPDAKITVVEYSSLTCPHCAHFATKVFPDFKTKFIDTGKVRFITRDFPLDNLAAAASMLARCLDNDKAFAFIDTLFTTQDTWAHGEGNPVPRLFEVSKPAGFTKESFDKCLTDQALLDKVTAARTRAGEKFQINSTPTFFVNGKRLTGVNQVEDFAKLINPLLEANAGPAAPATDPKPDPK